MKKSLFCLMVVSVLFWVNIVAGADLSPKEADLLHQSIMFAEDEPITKLGGVQVYSEKESSVSDLSGKKFTGCIPIEINSGGVKKFRRIIFDFLIAKKKSEDSPVDLIVTYKKVASFSHKIFTRCPDNEELNTKKLEQKNEKKP